MSIFSKRQVAGLLNDTFGKVYQFMKSNIVAQRDSNLKRTGSQSINGTELAMACFGDAQVSICYDRLMELMSSFYYRVESDEPYVQKLIEEQVLGRRELIWETLAVAKVTGISGLEPMWHTSHKQEIVPEQLVPVDSRRIIYSIDADTGKYVLRIATLDKPLHGEVVEQAKIIDFKYYGVYINNPYGIGCGGLLLELIKKKELVETIWFQIGKKYSEPIKIGKIPDTASKTEVDDFFEALNMLKGGSTFVLPPGFELDVKDVSSSGGDKIVKPLLDYYDQQISGLILGESITGKELSNGSQTRDIIAADISVRKAFSLAKAIATTLNNSLVKWLIAYNYPGAQAKIVVEEPEDLKELLNSYEILSRLGVKFDPEILADKFGIKHVKRKSLGSNF